jgi:hypothetical protein
MAVDAFTSLFARQARVLAGLPLYQLYVQKFGGIAGRGVDRAGRSFIVA